MIDIAAMVVMMEALSSGKPKTVAQLADITGLHRETVKGWVRAMHNRPKPVIYVADFGRSGTNHVPMYAMGYCVTDMPRPPVKGPAKVQKECRDRKKIAQGLLPAEREARLKNIRRQQANSMPRNGHLFAKKENPHEDRSQQP